MFKADAPLAAPERGVAVQFLVMIALAIVPAAIMAICFSYLSVGLFGLGPTEHFIIMFLGILLFGRRLPEMGRYFGKRIVERNGH